MANDDRGRGRSDHDDRGRGRSDHDRGRSDHDRARAELVETLLQKVRDDPFPSSTMLDLIEELLTPDEVPRYVIFLQDRLRAEPFPSIPMLKRLAALV